MWERFVADWIPERISYELREERYVETKLRWAMEWLSKKDYTDNWESEMYEAFCFWAYWTPSARRARPAGSSRPARAASPTVAGRAPLRAGRHAAPGGRARRGAAVAGHAPAARRPAARGVSRAAPVPACAALAALSLLLPWALAFDPQVWVAWGHDAFHGHLDTEAGRRGSR